MLIDREHKTWAYGSAVTVAIGSVLYWLYASSEPTGPSGGSLPGLWFGIVGSAMMVFAWFLSARKRVRVLPLGSAKFWLKGHIWFGALSLPFILFHSGFGLGGFFEKCLWAVFAFVYVSGFVGLGIQQLVPRLMASRLDRETSAAQVPFQIQRMTFVTDVRVASEAGAMDVSRPWQVDGDDHDGLDTHLTDFYTNASREEQKRKVWFDKVPDQHRELFRRVTGGLDHQIQDLKQKGDKDHSLVKFFKKTAEEEFPAILPKVYAPSSLAPTDKAAQAPAKDATPAKDASPESDQPAKTASPLDQLKAQQKKQSPLEQLKAQQTAGATEKPKKPSPLEQLKAQQAGPPKKLSPLEQIKAQQKQAEGKPEKQPTGGKKLSPLGQIKAQQAAANASNDDEEPPKKLSPLEQIKAQQKQTEDKAEKRPNDGKKLSALEQIKAQQAAAKASKDEEQPKKLSPLEQISAQQKQAEGKAEKQPTEGKKLSPLEQIKAQQAAANASDDGEETPKKLSPLEQIKAQQKGGEGKKLSPLEQINAQQAAASASNGDDEPPKKLSPLEQIKAQQRTVKPVDNKGKKSAKSTKPTSKSTSGDPAPPAAMPSAGRSTRQPAAPKAASPLDQLKKKDDLAGVPKPRPVAESGSRKPTDAEIANFRNFYVETVRPYVTSAPRKHVLAEERSCQAAFARERSRVAAPALIRGLEELEAVCHERRQYVIQQRLHRVLHGWLALHVPASMALLVLFVIHIIYALRVVPF